MIVEKNKNYTLLVFDWCGEREIEFFLLPDRPGWLKAVNNRFVNAVKTTEEQTAHLMRVYDAIQCNPEYYDNPNDPLAGAWVKHKVSSGMLNASVEAIIYCGFLP